MRRAAQNIAVPTPQQWHRDIATASTRRTDGDPATSASSIAMTDLNQTMLDGGHRVS
jgi:hypothetical protein